MMRQFVGLKLPAKNKEGKYNMCKAIMDLERKNQKIGEDIATDRTFITAIKNLMKTTHKPFEEACAMLCISQEDMVRYKDML